MDKFYSRKNGKYESECIDCKFKRFANYKKTKSYKLSRRKTCAKYKEKQLFTKAKYRAIRKHLEFSIKLSDIVIPNICPVLGIPIIRDSCGISDNSPSLDRIDNTKGYVKDNIQVISNRANMIKSIGTAEEHLKIANYINKHQSQLCATNHA
jgi:hypothetical protein